MGLSKLSDEELLKLHEESNAAQEPVAEAPAETNPVESFNRGMVEGIPFSTQAAGAIKAVVSDENVPFGERYEKGKSEWRKAQEEAKTSDPTSFGTGEIVGDVGGFVASNAMLPGSGLVKEALSLGSWIYSKEVSNNPSQSMAAALHNASVNTMVGLGAGKVIGKAGEKTGEYLKNLGDYTAAHWITDGIAKNWKILDAHVSKTYNKSGELAKSDATSLFIGSIKNHKVDGQPLLHGNSTIKSILDGSEKLMDTYGDRIGSIIKENDAPVSVDSLFNKLINTGERKPMSSVISASKDAAAEEIRRDLFTPVIDAKSGNIIDWTPKKLNLSDVHQLKKEWASVSTALQRQSAGGAVTATSDLQALELKNRVNSITSFIKESIPDTAEWSKANKDWADVRAVHEITVNKGNADHGASIFGKLKAASTVAAGSTAFAAHSLLGTDLATSSVIGVATKTLLANGEVLKPKLANGLYNLASYMKAAPNSRVAARMSAALSGNVDMFQTTTMQSISEVNLLNNPVERNNADLRNKSDDVLQIAQNISPELADNLRTAINNKDDAGMQQVMEQISKHPLAKGIIKDGIGWNGKVSDPNDIKQLDSQINSMAISHKQKLQHKKELLLNGTVPQVQQEKPYYIDYKARNKEEAAY